MEDDSISIWAFAAPIMGIHMCLLLGTNYLLYCVRNVADRYQEQKYIAMASVLMFEILIVGLPVMVAVNDSPIATHIILVGIIAVSDIGILCFTFIPKIFYQRTGLGEGVSFGESIMRSTLQRASLREGALRQSGDSFYNFYPSSEASEVARRIQNESSTYSSDELGAGPRIVSLSGRLLLPERISEEQSDQEEDDTSEIQERDCNCQTDSLPPSRAPQRSVEQVVIDCAEREVTDRSHLRNNGKCDPDERNVKSSDLTNQHEQAMKETAMSMTNASKLLKHGTYRRRPVDGEGEKGNVTAEGEISLEKALPCPPSPTRHVLDASEGNDTEEKKEATAAVFH
jgi:hypothetical protein